MLMDNTNIQTRVFAYLDLDHPPVAWAVMRGMLVSADLVAHDSSNGFISFMHAGMIEHQNNSRLFNEFIIENIRLAAFPDVISRLHGMYFFGSYDEAISRANDPNWPPYFKSDNLVEFELFSPEKVTIVDSDWITYAPLDSSYRIKTDNLEWVMHYWKGEARSSNPVWEYIAKGTAIVLDEKVRRRCFSYLKGRFPECEIPILMARLAGEAGSRGGLIAPFLKRATDSIIQLQYLSYDADFHDDEVIENISKHPDSGYLGRLMAENETWKSPDFRQWGREFRMGVQSDPIGAVGPVSSVHHVKNFRAS